MSREIELLRARIRALEEENLELKTSVKSLRQSEQSYEQIIGKTNADLLRADMARMELEQVISAYTDPMWVVREDCDVIRANQAMLELLGKTHDEVIGYKCYELLDYNLCTQSCPLQRIEFPNTQEFDIQFQGALEERHFLLTTATLLTLDGAPGIVAQFKDITERKQAEQALEVANRALEKMAFIDGLTQIANRRCFDETLTREWKRLYRAGQPLSMLLGDIDHFKKYNDHYGHQAGDDCLRAVARALKDATLRPADLVARYGGEEFALLLPETDLEGALLVGRRVLSAISALAIPHEKSTVGKTVSISLGAATLYPAIQCQPQELIALADEALYQAKENGRNQIIASRPKSGGNSDLTRNAPPAAS